MPAFCGERIGDAGFFSEFFADKPFELDGERAGADRFEMALELRKALAAGKQVADDEDRPRVGEELGGLFDRASAGRKFLSSRSHGQMVARVPCFGKYFTL